HTTFWIEHHLWGDDPRGYHVVNVLLHATTAMLLWIILRKLRVPGAWLAAAMFGVHPVMVESVAGITDRKNRLCGGFSLLCVLAYWRSGLLRIDEAKPTRRFGMYALALALFVCALLSKSVTATLPAVLLLLVWWKTGRIRLADIVPLIPFFVFGLALGSLTGW